MTIIYSIAVLVFIIVLSEAIVMFKNEILKEMAIKTEEQILDAKNEILDKLSSIETQILLLDSKDDDELKDERYPVG